MSDPTPPPPLTSQVAHIGGVVQYLLAELVAKNTNFAGYGQPLLALGPSDDAANAAPPSIYWIPTKEDWKPGERLGQPGDPGMLFAREIPVSFLLFGGVAPEGTYPDADLPFHDCDLTEVLLSKLVNVCQRNLSQKSYRIGSCEWFSGGRTGIGMSCELTILLRLPLIREDNPTVTVTNVKANAEIVTP